MTLLDFDEKSQSFEPPKNATNDQMEKLFWENIATRCSIDALNPVYGIDNAKTLFPRDCENENLSAMTANVNIIQKHPHIPGVNTPYFYRGMGFTCFCIHVEDSNLGSINKLHEGHKKTWYTVPAAHAKTLANAVQNATPKEIQCDLFIRHKSVLIPPSMFKKMGIPYAKVNTFRMAFRFSVIHVSLTICLFAFLHFSK